MAQHHLQAAGVLELELLEPDFQSLDESRGRRLGRFEVARAQHWRQCQGKDYRDQHRRAESQSELAHDDADHSAHEHHRRKDRDERDRDGEDGKSYLPRSGQGGLERPLAMLDPAPDRLDHDNSVVDHEANSDGQGHQAQVVESEVSRQHHRAGGQEGYRDHRRGNGGSHDVAKEQEDHHDYQHDGDQQRHLHFVDRRPDGESAIGNDVHIDARRHGSAQLREGRLHRFDRLNDVSTGLFENDDVDRPPGLERLELAGPADLAVGAALSVLHTEHSPAKVADADRRAVLVTDDEVVPGLGVQGLVVRVDGQSLLPANQLTLGRVHGGHRDGGADLIQLQAQRRSLAWVDLDADRGLAWAA